MTKYRILEKKGITRKGQCEPPCCGENSLWHMFSECTDTYIPRFIVQEEPKAPYSSKLIYTDIKEFTSLEEARAYKRDLELDEGIVRE